MMSETIHTLVASTSMPGRYALDETHGPTISRGLLLAIKINGRWHEGSIEYGPQLYVNEGLQFLGDVPKEPSVLDGYYFVGIGGGTCGLCVGMQVALR